MNQRKEQFYLLLLLLTGTLASCVKPFFPDIEKYDEVLVVDGNINDGPGPYTITLSKSSKAREMSRFNPYSNCTVEIEDDLGNKTMCTEKSPGVYKTDSLSIQGVPGRSYKLRIATSEGEWYESNVERLLKGVKIQSVYGEVKHKDDPKFFYGRDGYQFYVDAETPLTTDNYLLWRMECTYKFRVDNEISCYYDGGVHPVINQDTLRTCYRTQTIPQFYLLNTNELKQQDINRFPVNFEDNHSKALTFRYSLKVSQLTISKEAFTYWNTMKKLVDAGGELYTQQPFQLANNLRNTTNPDKPVLGYFMAAGFSEKRIFITPVPLEFRIGQCEIPLPQKNQLEWFVNSPHLWPVFYTGTPNIPFFIDQDCVDCRRTGALVPPPYWIE